MIPVSRLKSSALLFPHCVPKSDIGESRYIHLCDKGPTLRPSCFTEEGIENPLPSKPITTITTEQEKDLISELLWTLNKWKCILIDNSFAPS